MAKSDSLQQALIERIYVSRISGDMFAGVSPSPRPSAVLVAGQPGAGKTFAAQRVRAHLDPTIGGSVLISSRQLRSYHPAWREGDQSSASQEVDAAVSIWYARLVSDVIERGVNALFESTVREPNAAVALAMRLKTAGYDTAAVFLATDRDQSRQATMAHYDLAMAVGIPPRFVSAAAHDTAYDRLRISLERLEEGALVQRIQLVVRDGRQLYANELDIQGKWARDPRAAAVLDDFRNRRLTSSELASSALRWLTLAQRLSTNPVVPRDVASQAITWRNEAVALAEEDPQAAKLLAWGREAEAFRTLPPLRFQAEFAHLSKAIEKLDEAVKYADTQFAHAADRSRFVEQARSRLAERIAEGRIPLARAEKGKGARPR
jgi:hypothetical protein